MSTRLDFSKAVLTQVGITPNLLHIGARRALVAWMGEESGWHARCDGTNGAAYNPLATILVLPGCTSSHDYNTVPGVKNYLNFPCGTAATAATLRESRYAGLVSILATPGVFGKTVLHAVADSDWGSFKTKLGTPDYAGADAIYDTYLAQRHFYNSQVMG